MPPHAANLGLARDSPKTSRARHGEGLGEASRRHFLGGVVAPKRRVRKGYGHPGGAREDDRSQVRRGGSDPPEDALTDGKPGLRDSPALQTGLSGKTIRNVFQSRVSV